MSNLEMIEGNRAREARRDGRVRSGKLTDPRRSYVTWAEERVKAGEDSVRMAAACERLCYALEAFEDEADALGYGASVLSMAVVHYFGPDYSGDVVARDIAGEARECGYAGNFFVIEEDGRPSSDEEAAR